MIEKTSRWGNVAALSLPEIMFVIARDQMDPIEK